MIVFKIVKKKIKGLKELKQIYQENSQSNKSQKLHLKDTIHKKINVKLNNKFLLQKIMIIDQEEFP